MAKLGKTFVRWQGITITQMGYAVNLILTLATASLGFAITLLKDAKVHPGYCGRWVLFLGVLLLIASVAFGVLCVWNRLKDFEETAQIARCREKMVDQGVAKPSIDEYLSTRRDENDERGRRTKMLFAWQLRTFGFGVCLLVVVYLWLNLFSRLPDLDV